MIEIFYVLKQVLVSILVAGTTYALPQETRDRRSYSNEDCKFFNSFLCTLFHNLSDFLLMILI